MREQWRTKGRGKEQNIRIEPVRRRKGERGTSREICEENWEDCCSRKGVGRESREYMGGRST